MEAYKTRKIEFRELVEVNDWKVKVYTISQSGEFDHPEFYRNALGKLPSWLEMKNGFDSSHDNVGFLILHAASEGILSLINWWVGKNMLNTNIFVTDPEIPTAFKKISGNGLGPCIWELEIMNHERISWLNNVMKMGEHPDFESYLEDTISKEL